MAGDLSKLHDLTAAALFGHYEGVDIIIPGIAGSQPAAMVKAHESDPVVLDGKDGWLIYDKR